MNVATSERLVYMKGRLARWRTYLVEVAFAFFFLGRHMTIPLFQEYIQDEIKNAVQKEQAEVPLVPLGNSSYSAEQQAEAAADAFAQEVQRQSAITVLALQVAEALPAMLAVVILGALSDRTKKRKILLWVPNLGMLSYSFIYIMTIYTGWSLDGLFMASVLRGLTGSMPAFHTGATFYAVNSVMEESKSSRLALQEFLNGITFAIGNLIVGIWVRNCGFIQPFWFVFACSALSLLVSVFGVEELDIPEATQQPSNGRPQLNIFKRMLNFFKCHNNASRNIWLAIISFQTFSFIHLGQESTSVLYLLGRPHNWSSLSIGLYLAIMMSLSAAGTLFGAHILKNYISDNSMTLVGYVSKALGTMWFAIIYNDVLVYGAVLLLVLQLLPMPMLRSIVSGHADPNDHGSLFALMHCGQSLTFFLAPLMFTAIYTASLHFFSGFVFIVSALLLSVPFGLTVALRKYDEEKLTLAVDNYRHMSDNVELDHMPDDAPAYGSQRDTSVEDASTEVKADYYAYNNIGALSESSHIL